MTIHFSTHLKIATAWAAIGLVGLGAGWSAYQSSEVQRRRDLIDHAQLAAVAFDAAELRLLGGRRDDMGTPGYAALKARLRRAKAMVPLARFVYVFRHQPDTRKVIYLGDSAVPGAKDESLPGDEYTQAPESPGLQEIIRTGEPACEGPLSDEFGTWITGYAAIGPGWGGSLPAPRHILGIDVGAADWRRALWQGGLERAVLVWIVLGIPLGAWMVFQRQREQNEVIRNLSEAMEQSHSAIMITDRDGRIEYVNRGVCRQSGYPRRELLGRSWRDFQVTDAATPVVQEIVASVRAGLAWEGEWSSRRKDGAAYPVRGGFTPVKHRDDTIACFVAVFDDVTETKQREAELRVATELAQAGDRAKGHFLATMSHEVRTPLNGIVGFTGLLLETPLTAEQSEYVQTIRMSTEALIQLTGDILDFARIESGKLKLDPAPCDPRDCVEDTLELFAAKAAEKGLALLHRVEPEVPAAILTDGGRLRQVLVNLIGNAVKFTDHGEVTVTMARAACTLVVTVRDTGIGIPAEHHTKLFRAFSQIDESTTRRYGGTGLGLAICHNLVGLMGGTIRVDSAPGQGSTFTFSIRAEVVVAAPPVHDLRGAPIALAAPPGALRREFVALVRAWRGRVLETDAADQLPGGSWQVAVVDVTAALVERLAAWSELPRGWVPEKMIGLVPISLTNERRTTLRRHFRLLVNKPIRHEAFYALLAGIQQPGPAPAAPATQYGLRVLVVEDNAVNQRLIKRVLENLGCSPTLVENGREALEVLTKHPRNFDLMLLDMHMPELDGIATIRAVRAGEAGPGTQGIWTIALSADARDEQRKQAMAAGLNDYLTKPLNLGELEVALRRFGAEGGGPKG